MSAAERPAALMVAVGAATVAVPAGDVAEVLRVPDVTRVPNAPAALLGLANLRGAVLPVFSLARLLGEAPKPSAAASRVVVLAGGMAAGLLVDAVIAISETSATPLDAAALLARGFPRVASHAAARPGTQPGSQPVAEQDAAGPDLVTLVSLDLADRHYALPLDRVAAVMRLPALLEPPRGDAAVLGVTMFRGALLPIVSLRGLLGLPAAIPEPSWRVVVARADGAAVGLLVDRVPGLLEVPAASIDPPPPLLSRGAGEARLDGICRLPGGGLIGLLAVSGLFDAATTANLRTDAEEPPMPLTDAPQDEAESFVVFRLGAEEYGVPIAAVDEVVRHPGTLTRLPQAPDFVAGMMNLRGRAIAVVDTRRRFGVPQETRERGREEVRGGRIMVLTVDGVQTGFAVDAVAEVLRAPARALHAGFAEADDPLFDRVAMRQGDRLVLLISARGLLRDAERTLLASLASRSGDPAPP